MEHVLTASEPIPASPSARNWRRAGNMLLAVLVATGVGLADYLSGWELSVYLLYAIPILFLVWRDEREGALFLAIVCGLVWWAANDNENPYRSPWSYHWSAASRTIYFIMVAVGGNALRAKQEGDRARIAALERTRRLELEIVRAGEREQQRIGRDMHDGLCQQLAAIGCAARSLANKLRAESRPESADAEQIEGYINDSAVQARSMARGIVPVVASGSGLAAALEELVSTTTRLTGVNVTFKEEGEVRVNDLEAAMHLFRIAQEAVNNAVRHSGARKIEVSLGARGDQLRLAVADDGCGLGRSVEASAGIGLRTMEYRAHAMGAELSVLNRKSGGLLVVCRLTPTRPGGHGRAD